METLFAPLDEETTQEMALDVNLAEICEAVFTITEQNKLVSDLLNHLDINKIMAIQHAVVNNEIEAIFNINF